MLHHFVKNCGSCQWLPTRVTRCEVPGLQRGPRSVEGRVEMSSNQKSGVPRNKVCEASIQMPGGRAAGSGHVRKTFCKVTVKCTTWAHMRRRAASQPHDSTHPDSLPSCKSSRTVTAAAREPRAPWPTKATPPSPPSMLAGTRSDDVDGGQPLPYSDANSRRRRSPRPRLRTCLEH